MKKILLKFFGRGYSTEELRLAFEYGLVIAKTAQEMKMELTPDAVKKAEIMLVGEFSSQNATHLAGNMLPNILSAFELDISK